LTVLVLVPIVTCVSKASTLTLDQFRAAVWTERTRAAYLLTFGTSLAAASVNVILGLLVAWVLVRYRFPGRRLMDSLIDLPLAPRPPGGAAWCMRASTSRRDGSDNTSSPSASRRRTAAWPSCSCSSSSGCP